MKLFYFILALGVCAHVGAQENLAQSLPDITVEGRGEDLLGVADSASEGTTGAKELSVRPFARPGEIMETVPGLIITQHDGGGKANQYFLRGFNLDHGTDLAMFVDGVPINMPSHAHGQGYSDTNWLIPELVQEVHYEKGPFSAQYGDFSNAGAVEIEYVNTLPKPMILIEGGNLGDRRILAAGADSVGDGHFLYAVDASHYDGAWTVPDDYQKVSAMLRYTSGADKGKVGDGYSLSAQTYYGQWVGSEQIPERAIDEGIVGRYGNLDPSDGGFTHRISTYGDWHTQDQNSQTEINAYAIQYGLDLYSNFTYFLDQINGDQIQQVDSRVVEGTSAKRQQDGHLGDTPIVHSYGLQIRHDDIQNKLNSTTARTVRDNVTKDTVALSQLAPWYSLKAQWLPDLRTTLGLRFDVFDFNDAAKSSVNSGHTVASALNPKFNLVLGPWSKNEFYFSIGTGFHTADARAVFLRQQRDGSVANSLPPIIRSRGAEIGLRNGAVDGLKTTIAFWALQTDSETVYSADQGSVEDSGRAAQRMGVEWTNFYDANEWVTADADFSSSQAKFTQSDINIVGDHVPEAVTTTVAGGITVHDFLKCDGCFISLRWRYFGPRDLASDASEKSQASTVFNMASAYKLSKAVTLKLEILNLLNAKYNDAEYYDVSRLKGEPIGPAEQGGYVDHLIHPGEPISARIGLIAYF